jgi:hypothetical protein
MLTIKQLLHRFCQRRHLNDMDIFTKHVDRVTHEKHVVNVLGEIIEASIVHNKIIFVI